MVYGSNLKMTENQICCWIKPVHDANLCLLRVQVARFVQCAVQFGRSSKKSAVQFSRSPPNFPVDSDDSVCCRQQAGCGKMLEAALADR